MRLREFATPDAQLELWKMVSDAVWAAINKQKAQQGQPTATPQQDPAMVARAQDAKVPVKPTPIKPKLRVAPKKSSAVKKLPKIKAPPPKPAKSLTPSPKSKQKQVAINRPEAPAVALSQRQQLATNRQPTVTSPQPPISKTPGFDPESGVFPQNQRLLKPTQKRG